jgi:hypothetical protein
MLIFSFFNLVEVLERNFVMILHQKFQKFLLLIIWHYKITGMHSIPYFHFVYFQLGYIKWSNIDLQKFSHDFFSKNFNHVFWKWSKSSLGNKPKRLWLVEFFKYKFSQIYFVLMVGIKFVSPWAEEVVFGWIDFTFFFFFYDPWWSYKP